MADTSDLREGMEVIGADGVHVGTIDRIEDERIKLKRTDPGHSQAHGDHHHYLSRGLIAGVDGDTVRLSANADVAVQFEEEER